MSLDTIGIFGGTGALLLALGGYLWKCAKGYDVEYVMEPSIVNNPTDTLVNTWEHPGPNVTVPFKTSFKRMVYAKHGDEKTWTIDMKKDDGNVYVYTDFYHKPNVNNGNRFLRVRLKNVPKGADIEFVHKYWAGTSSEWQVSKYHPESHQRIPDVGGVHVYYEPSLIGQDDVTKEQLGITFRANVDYKGCVIEEAYCKQRYSLCKVLCCKRHWMTVLYARKKTFTEER
jgi:hypothetical protein